MESNRFNLHSMQMMYFLGRTDAVEMGGSPIRAYSELRCENYNHERMLKAVHLLFESHDMLRAAIYSDGTQEILENIEATVNLVKLDSLYEESEEYILSRREEIFQKKFDLDKPPLIYFETTLFSDNSAVIHIYHDGIIMDGWSHEMLTGDLDSFYSGRYTEPLDIKCKYKAYVKYCENLNNTEKYREDKEFWIERISRIPKAPSLISHNEKICENGIYKQAVRKLSKETYEKLKKNAFKKHLSPFVIFLTAFGKAISRYSSEQPFLLNIPMANRPPEIEDLSRLIGDCSDFMLYDWNEKTDETIIDTAYKVQENFFELLEHRTFPGIEVVRMIQKQNPGVLIAPIVLTSTLDIPYREHDELKKIYSKTHTSQVWADTILMYTQNEIAVCVDYNNSEVSDTFLSKILDSFVSLINVFAESPEGWNNIYQAPIPREDEEITENRITKGIKDRNFGEIYQEVFMRLPDKPAAVSNGGIMTYRQIKNYAGKMIDSIYERCNTDRHIRVGMLLKKGIFQATAEISCLIGNMTFIPIEKENTDNLILKMLRNIEITCLITDDDIAAKWSELIDCPVFKASEFVTEKEYDYTIFRTENRDPECYCIHSSGTTGQPKGIILDEAGLVNCIFHTNERMNITENDTCISVTNFCHDMSVYDITGIIAAGGTVVFPDGDSEAKNPELWHKLIRDFNVTVWNSCPSIMEMLMTEKERLDDIKGNLKLVILGGEVFTAKLAEQIRDVLAPDILYNAGGPAEATIWSILHEVTDKDIESGIIPYGRGIAGNRYVIFDKYMHRCPPGVEGMMYITGIGLAEGYCNLPEETASKFIEYKGERYYNTGDCGWYMLDGLIAFGGRKDFQVELNGKRVELEGIASIAQEVENVEKCVAVIHNQKKIIVLFYTVSGEVYEETIRNHTESMLPCYMYPAVYIRLEKFPLALSGKTDIKKLREYKLKPTVANFRDLTDTDRVILDICGEIIGNTDELASGRSFYQSGGNSLDAIKIISSIRKKLNVDISLSEFLKNPYLSSWSEIVSNSPSYVRSGTCASVDFRKDGSILSQEQESMWIYDNISKNTRYVLSASLNINCVDKERLENAVTDYIRSEDILNVVFEHKDDGTLIQKFKDSTSSNNLQTVTVQGREIAENFIRISADMPMDLERGPLYRFMLFDIGNNEYIFNVSVHHIIADEQSFCIIFRKIMDLYSGKKNTVVNSETFFDYISVKNNESEFINASWKSLAEAETLGTIIVPEDAEYDILSVHKSISIDMGQVEKLKNICKKYNVSLFTGFTAVYLHMLKSVSGKKRFWISVPMSDRNCGNFEHTVGMFIKKVIIDAEVKDGQPFAETLISVQRGILDASSQMKNSFSSYIHKNGITQIMNELYVDTVMNFMDSGNETGYGSLRYVTDKKDIGANNLQLMTELTADECRCNFYFNEELYSKKDIAFVTKRWTEMFDILTENVNLDNKSVKTAVLNDNGSKSIIEMFLENADNFPKSYAVSDFEATLTYSELRERVLFYAEKLHAEGVRAGDAVGVYCIQKNDTVAIIYALFVIGAIYVPIDRNVPSERAEYITSASRCRYMVSSVEIPYSTKVPQIIIQYIPEGRRYSSCIFKDTEHTAYIIFTSGTTGIPKGVPIKEKYLINMCRWYSDEFDIHNDSRSVMLNNYSFDGSLKTIFTPLMFGGCIVLGPEIAYDISEAVKIISDKFVTHLAGVPSLLKEIIQAASYNNYEALKSVKWTISAGEKFRVLEMLMWAKSPYFKSRLANLYGPAECSCIVSSCEVKPADLEKGDISIGDPICNKRLYLLDENGYPCGENETGYIWIAGFGTFDGYIGTPREKSGLSPDIVNQNEYMYKSGDIGKLLPDGKIIYAGRYDNQIKISGQRIEAEEMESVLNQYSDISESVLKLFSKDNGFRTVMFFTSSDGRKIDSDVLRDYLSKHFHAGILPNDFVQLKRFPLNSNGKIDRNKLEIPEYKKAAVMDSDTTNDILENVHRIWCDLLERRIVSYDEDFFKAGGYSLLLYKCQKKLENEFKIEFPMKILLKKTTIRGIAEYVLSQKNENNLLSEETETVRQKRRIRKRNKL